MADPTDADLRALFAGAFQSASPTDECPPPEQLFDAFHRVSPLDEIERILDHIAVCAVCADAWRLASRTGPPAPERS
ncbi:MAG: hypothetical protein H6737_06675 [Alphaproteobacteria bacterium]|nr:hypothetical protein [Alphaproteobacteria bacterium]